MWVLFFLFPACESRETQTFQYYGLKFSLPCTVQEFLKNNSAKYTPYVGIHDVSESHEYCLQLKNGSWLYSENAKIEDLFGEIVVGVVCKFELKNYSIDTITFKLKLEKTEKSVYEKFTIFKLRTGGTITIKQRKDSTCIVGFYPDIPKNQLVQLVEKQYPYIKKNK